MPSKPPTRQDASLRVPNWRHPHHEPRRRRRAGGVGEHAPRFPIDLVKRDLGYALQMTEAIDADALGTVAAGETFARAQGRDRATST